jgi:anti-anti-sigma factor
MPVSCAYLPTPNEFAVTSELGGEQLVLRVLGELDLATASALEHHIEIAWSNDPPALVLDLKELTFMDCRGVRLILQTHERAIAADKSFSLRRVPRHAQRVFDLLGLTEQIPSDDLPRSVSSS